MSYEEEDTYLSQELLELFQGRVENTFYLLLASPLVSVKRDLRHSQKRPTINGLPVVEQVH
jgi:hypothetical protein